LTWQNMKLHIFFLILLIFIVSACSISPETPAVSPSIVSDGKPEVVLFLTNTSSISPGGSVHIFWHVKNADQVSIDQGIGPVASIGTMKVNPMATTSYLLEASNKTGSVAATLRVTVTPDPYPAPEEPGILPAIPGQHPPVIKKFAAVKTGDNWTVDWEVVGASTIVIEPHIGMTQAASGSKAVPAKDTLYELTATASDASKARRVTSVGYGASYTWTMYSPKSLMCTLYDFSARAPYATWITGAGPLNYAKDFDSKAGAVIVSNGVRLEDGETYDKVLQTRPQQIENGVIYGYYTELYDVNYLNHRVISAKIGFDEKKAGVKARFRVILRREGKEPLTLLDVTKEADGKLQELNNGVVREFNQQEYEAADLYFRVDAIGTFDGVSPVWVGPSIDLPCGGIHGGPIPSIH